MSLCPRCEGSGVIQDDTFMGNQMRSLRKKADVGIHAQALEMRISITQLADLENGNYHWTIKSIASYAHAILKLKLGAR